MLKTNLCESSSLILAINNSLNSRSNSKDISNAVQFIHNLFKMLSKEEQYDGENSFISALLQNENETHKNAKRRRTNKQKPRHYDRAGLTLKNIENRCVTSYDGNDDNMTHFSTSSCVTNVHNMSSKALYQLFCKKMLRFNKTHKLNRSQIAQQVW